MPKKAFVISSIFLHVGTSTALISPTRVGGRQHDASLPSTLPSDVEVEPIPQARWQEESNSSRENAKLRLDAMVTQSGIRHMFDFFSTTFPETWSDPVTLPCGQRQLPLHERIAKMAHEECFPWIVSAIIWGGISALAHSMDPLHFGMNAEALFLAYQIHKVSSKFNPPVVPQPMLQSRRWDWLRDMTWASHETLEAKREYLMGWFYKAPFQDLRREDAREFLAWMRYGINLDGLSTHQQEDLHDDLIKLESEVNEGKRLATRNANEIPLPIMRFNLEPLRFRVKPLPFYGVIHGIRSILSVALPKNFGFIYHPPKDSSKDLGYWFRPATDPNASTNKNLIFVHGVGGMGFYYEMLQEISRESDGNIVLLDLPFVSLQIADDIPSIQDQVTSVTSIMDSCFGKQSMASFVGHSFGSIVLSWMVQSRPERVANCVFIDPICFHQHLCKSLFNFHFARTDDNLQSGKEWPSPISIEGLMNLAGTEMHTNNAMLRQFSWNANALWPEELHRQGISSYILLSEHDAIVPSHEVQNLVTNFNAKIGRQALPSYQNFFSEKDEVTTFVRSHIVDGVQHGELLFNGQQRHIVLKSISIMLQKQAARGKTGYYPAETIQRELANLQ